MIATLGNSTYSVVATVDDVRAFAASWPCSGLDLDCGFLFEFSASNGDLVDLEVVRDGKAVPHEEGDDGAALAAMSEDACRFGAEELGLKDVLAIHFGDAPSP